MKGFIHVYTGDGKGKTTAALGLALRACGARLRVYIGQFIKCGNTCEARIVRRLLPGVVIVPYGPRCFIRKTPTAAEKAEAARGMARLRSALTGGRYDVVVADEICGAIACGLIAEKDVLDLMAARPDSVELVLTGRSATRRIVRAADLVTDMRCVKHYYAAGVNARRGIEW